MSISEFRLIPSNIVNATPSAPGGTTSTAAYVMCGLAIAFTPKYTGTIYINIQANVSNNTNGDGTSIQIMRGTGTAPVNGAATTGTSSGLIGNAISSVANDQHCITLIGFATGLTIATPIWIDLQQEAITGGTTGINNVIVRVFEVQT